ncbi:MAG: hypothetical protein ACYS8K_08950 [Planctomycetota bacterium]|jgi:hypothetical protein
MENWIERLAGSERLDLAALLARRGEQIPFLARLARFPWGDGSLLDLTQATMHALLDDPPPAPCAPEDAAAPAWWSPMPAAHVAALFLRAGLPEVSSPEAGRAGVMLPHARESALLARELLRQWGLPFVVREHAVALILARGRPAGLLGSGAPAEAYRKLACVLDLRALYHLRRAELLAVGRLEDRPAGQRLESFRERAERAGVFGRPPELPAAVESGCAALFADADGRPVGVAREKHRALNALRYFALVAGMHEEDWRVERLRVE